MRTVREAISDSHIPSGVVLDSEGDIRSVADYTDVDGAYLEFPDAPEVAKDMQDAPNPAFEEYERRLDLAADKLGSYALARSQVGKPPGGYLVGDVDFPARQQQELNRSAIQSMRDDDYNKKLQAIHDSSLSDEEKARAIVEVNVRRRLDEHRRGRRA